MNRLMSNLKLLHKLSLPAVMILIAATVTMISAKRWSDLSEANIATVVDQDAARLELSLTAVSKLNAATILEHDLRIAGTLEEAERLAAGYRASTQDVKQIFDALTPLMVDPEQRRIATEAAAAYQDFVELSDAVAAAKIASFTSNAAPAAGGKGRVLRAKVDELLGKTVAFSKEDMREAKGNTIHLGRQSATMLVVLSGIAQLLALAMLAWIAIAQVSRPLNHMSDLMGRLAAGDLEIAVSGAERRDEVGVLARALTVFKENAISARDLAAEQAVERERRDARTAFIEGHVRTFDASVESALEALVAASAEMRSTSASMSTVAEDGGKQVATAATAFKQASANVQTVASASEELTASIAEIAAQVTRAAEIAGKAVHETEETDTKVSGLAEAASRIGEVVQLINDIASQTNLLALNATIEAARAGDAGKGFAVVASEVKALANQTAKATEEIAGQVAGIRSATADVVTAIKTIGSTINQVSEISSSIASAVEEQNAATGEISRNTQEAAANTESVSDNIAGLGRMAEASRNSAARELQSADQLGKQAEALRTDIKDFLVKIRAA
jgi:methyl-accepting chemotaxis protein